jgi:hypothetical protein
VATFEDRDPFELPHDMARLAHRKEQAQAKLADLVERWDATRDMDLVFALPPAMEELHSIAAAMTANCMRLVSIMRADNPDMAEMVAAVDAARARHDEREAARLDAEIDRRIRAATGEIVAGPGEDR